MSGYGQEGPYREYPGHDLNLQAISGVCHMSRDDRGRPMGAALPIADLSSSLTAVSGILAALLGRARTGRGRVLDIALVDTVLSWAYVWSEGLAPANARLSSALGPAARMLHKVSRQTGGRAGSVLERIAVALESPKSSARADAVGERLKSSERYQELRRLKLHALPHYALYRTRDDRYLSIGIVDEDKFWAALCEGLNLGVLAKIPLAGRFAAGTPLRAAIAHAIGRRDLAHWLETLDRRQVPVAPVLPVEEALQDPQLRRRRPSTGHIQAPWPLATEIAEGPPALGEHTDAVLAALELG
jgi:crotonobetainyl-CoA:carnitine CoA-transferase CaiB-like acyl-CoA transferase